MCSHVIDITKDYNRALLVATELLKKEDIIITPSETVYGLAGNIYSLLAIDKIYRLKNRPKDNPLICHIADFKTIYELASLSYKQEEFVKKLSDAFWPGGLTVILPKNKSNPQTNYAANNFSTVAVRMPAHPFFLDIIRTLGSPIAAPSANISGRPSGTHPDDIKQEFGSSVSLIVKDHPSTFGIESTVLDLTDLEPVILRPGAISLEEIKKVLPSVRYPISCYEKNSQHKSPGTKYKHYKPNFRIYIWEDIDQVLNIGSPHKTIIFHNALWKNRLETYGKALWYDKAETLTKELFHLLYELERQGVKELWIQKYPETNGGYALMERIRRMAED